MPVAVLDLSWRVHAVRVSGDFCALTLAREEVRLVLAIDFSRASLEAAVVASLRAMWPWLNEKRFDL